MPFVRGSGIASRVIEPVIGVKKIVAEVLPYISMKLVFACFRNDFDIAGTVSAISSTVI